MSDVKYTYAVARIRAMEMSLFNSAMIEQLLAMKDYDACLQFLAEKGWGDPDTPMERRRFCLGRARRPGVP